MVTVMGTHLTSFGKAFQTSEEVKENDRTPIIIVMVIFMCYFSREHIALS